MTNNDLKYRVCRAAKSSLHSHQAGRAGTAASIGGAPDCQHVPLVARDGRWQATAVRLLVGAFLLMPIIAPIAMADEPWVVYDGNGGPGKGTHIVLISGDEEYRSEEALPQLAKILAKRHGFRCTVMFAVDPDTGFIDPNFRHNIPGLDQLETADLMIIATRFRDLPDDQMRHIDEYLHSGRPVIGMRTATHAFNIPDRSKTYAHYSNDYNGERSAWTGGFGRLVLGEKWISHHGHHRHEATRGIIAADMADHPIVRGIQDGDIWGPSDVYGVRLPLPDDSRPLVMGQVTRRSGEFDPDDRWFGMRPEDPPLEGEKNVPMMPVAWLKSYQLPNGKEGKTLATTMGAATDLQSAGLRRMLVNGVYFLLGMEVPAGGTNVDLVGQFAPSAYGFHEGDYFLKQERRPADFKW